jgi:hypothetical protein
MFPRKLSAGFVGCLGVKKLTPLAHDFRAVRAMQNSGMIHSFWECFAE